MSDLLLPDYINGRPTFIADHSEEIQRLLKEGDPTIGWEGDPWLYLRKTDAGGWAVWRLGEDGKEYCICFNKPGQGLDKSLLIQLRDHDTRRVDVFAKVEAHNAKLERDTDQKHHEKHFEKLEKVYWALNKDVGYHY